MLLRLMIEPPPSPTTFGQSIKGFGISLHRLRRQDTGITTPRARLLPAGGKKRATGRMNLFQPRRPVCLRRPRDVSLGRSPC